MVRDARLGVTGLVTVVTCVGSYFVIRDRLSMANVLLAFVPVLVAVLTGYLSRRANEARAFRGGSGAISWLQVGLLVAVLLIPQLFITFTLPPGPRGALRALSIFGILLGFGLGAQLARTASGDALGEARRDRLRAAVESADIQPVGGRRVGPTAYSQVIAWLSLVMAGALGLGAVVLSPSVVSALVVLVAVAVMAGASVVRLRSYIRVEDHDVVVRRVRTTHVPRTSVTDCEARIAGDGRGSIIALTVAGEGNIGLRFLNFPGVLPRSQPEFLAAELWAAIRAPPRTGSTLPTAASEAADSRCTRPRPPPVVERTRASASGLETTHTYDSVVES